MTARTTTARLLAELNALRGLAYPEIGYAYFADVTGSGVYSQQVYVIVNAQGGVTWSPSLNGRNARHRCEKIRLAIANERHALTASK